MIVLDAHTDYSFMRGFGTPEQWLSRAREIGVTALGIADYCSTWGHHPMRAKFSGIKLMYGVQLPVVTFLDKDPRHSLVTLLAKERTDELYAAVTTAHAQMYYRPRLTWRQVGELKDCVVILNEVLRQHARAVPQGDDVFVGHKLLPSSDSGPRVLAYGPSYPGPEHRTGFELFQAISSNHRIGELEHDEFHMLREGEARTIFARGWTSDLDDNAARIARMCVAEPPRGRLLDMGVRGDKATTLWGMACAGARRLGLMTDGDEAVWRDPAYGDRLRLELDVIREKNFEDYFFFVHDVISWSKERMFVGPGRGSAGGSLLCYLLGITTVDPIRFGTLFERFIDVTRPDLPDIDIDFPDTRREEVFTYLREKYGRDRVARIGTLTEQGGKSALNNVARATDVPFDASREVGKWTEGPGQGRNVPFDIVFGVEEIQPVLKRYPSLLLAREIDGHVSHHGSHASGVVVTDEPATKFGAVDKEGVLSMDYRTAEEIGLVKMDALGLRTLSVIQETCDLVGINPTRLYELDWNDHAVFDGVFNADRVTGVFQFEGSATRGLMKQVRIDKFDDVCALASLSRPGPLIGGAAAGWVKARNGEAVQGDLLHPALEETFGALVYQEQMMFVARDVVGFSIPQVNGMRRAVAKKDPIKLRTFREDFINGCQGAAAYCRASRELATGQAGQNRTTGEQLAGRPESAGQFGQVPGAMSWTGPGVGAPGTGSGSVGPRTGRSGEPSPQGREQEKQFPEQSSPPVEQLSSPTARGYEPSDWLRSRALADGYGDAICELGEPDRAAALWEELNEFGSYSFNKAHAVAYGMISYMAAWLKHYHPLEFTVAQLRNAADDDQIKALLRELVEAGYTYVPLDPSKSQASWAIIEGHVYGGFDSLRGVGTKTAERYVALRTQHGADKWIDKLTEAQRAKIEKGETRWVSLSHFTETYRDLYADPDGWRSVGIRKGIKPPVHRIRDIPDAKGSYAFLGRIIKRNVVDDDAPERVAKRDGKKRGRDHQFINLTVEDDTGELGGTINRFKYEQFKWLAEEDIVGRDFLFRGNVIEAGRRWFFVDNVIELVPQEPEKGTTNATQSDGQPGDGADQVRAD